jgi:DNA-binding SARP family transcriptional activator/tetratricopeptide (TPR) repeat protein
VYAGGNGAAVNLGHHRQQCVLAVLLVEANRPVPADALLARAWGDRLPRRPRDTLYSYVSRLRQALLPAGTSVERRRSGYLINVDPLGVDLHLFDHLVRQSRAGADDQSALDRLEQALALWTGDAFGTLDTPWLNAMRRELDGRRRMAERDRDELALRLGGHAAVLDRLLAHADEEPLDEPLAGQALLALYRCGRQAEALARYERLRRRLAEDLGIHPGEPLRRLHQQILRADPALATPAGRSPARRALDGPDAGRSAGAWTVPRQLPSPPAGFTGRTRELAELSAAMRPDGDAGTAVVISAVGGAGGVGKTWLALYWAHRHQHEYPDGQLYVNLRGFEPGGEPLPAATAIRSFLAALGVPASALPVDPDGQVGLFRSLLAGRRVLVVLDNARDSAQVVSLLPGAPGCAVLITSRQRLTGLAAAHGARPLTLDVMPEPEAAALLQARLGPALTAEPEALDALLPHCGGLPLALGIVAARAATGPRGGLAALAAELGDRRTRLDALDAGDLALSLRAVMASSVRNLSTPAAALLGYLGAAPGPDISLVAAVSMAGSHPAEVRAALRELVGANLLVEDPPHRYRMHDLVRLYAIELATAVHESDRAAAQACLLDHYLHTACAMDRALQPMRDPIPLPVQPGVAAVAPADRSTALAWFAAEHQTLLAAARWAASAGYDRHTWQLAWACEYLLDQRGTWHDQVAMHEAALAAARRLDDDTALAHAHRGLARGYTWLQCFENARHHLRQARNAYQRLGDPAGQGFVQRSLARVSARQGHPAQALQEDRLALEFFEAAGHDHGRALTLNALGWHHAHLGDHEQATAYCQRAIAIQQRIGDRAGEGLTWDSLAYTWYLNGRHRQAVTGFRRAATLLHEQAYQYQEALVTEHLGDAYAALDQPQAARTAWQRAADLLTTLGHPDANTVLTKLALDTPQDSGNPPRLVRSASADDRKRSGH